jgi:hypothetical protein
LEKHHETKQQPKPVMSGKLTQPEEIDQILMDMAINESAQNAEYKETTTLPGCSYGVVPQNAALGVKPQRYIRHL